MTISVKIGTNLSRKTVLVENSTTVRKVLEDNEINYSTSTVSLDGAPLQAGDMDKSLEAFGIADTCYLIAAQKTENA